MINQQAEQAENANCAYSSLPPSLPSSNPFANEVEKEAREKVRKGVQCVLINVVSQFISPNSVPAAPPYRCIYLNFSLGLETHATARVRA